MSNDYFRFKRFLVRQDRCAMKVSTDACVQGAWMPLPLSVNRVLDIGTGTGLLALMLAQRAPGASIDAMELDKEAAKQAAENAAESEFAARVNVVQRNAVDWTPAYAYDLIACNPPFFQRSLAGDDVRRNAARHIDSLDPETLARLARRLLAVNGLACFLWPAMMHEVFLKEAVKAGLYLQSCLAMRHRAGSPVTRIISVYGRVSVPDAAHSELVIKDDEEVYTATFRELLQPFYLNL